MHPVKVSLGLFVLNTWWLFKYALFVYFSGFTCDDSKASIPLNVTANGDVTVTIYHARSTFGGKVQGKVTVHLSSLYISNISYIQHLCCWWLIWSIQNDAKYLKMIETLANGYSSESTQQELSNEYQHDRVWMFFKILCVCVLWAKVASAFEGLSSHWSTLESGGMSKRQISWTNCWNEHVHA